MSKKLSPTYPSLTHGAESADRDMVEERVVVKAKASKTKTKLVAAFLAGTMVLSGCATDSNTYSRNSVGVATQTTNGRLIGIEPVQVQGSNSGLGALSGAALGGALGSQVGNNRRGFRRGGGSLAAGVGFAILGGLVGAALEEGASGGDGFRYTIELSDGRQVSVVQRDKQPVGQIGGNVRVEYGRIVRVLPG